MESVNYYPTSYLTRGHEKIMCVFVVSEYVYVSCVQVASGELLNMKCSGIYVKLLTGFNDPSGNMCLYECA